MNSFIFLDFDISKIDSFSYSVVDVVPSTDSVISLSVRSQVKTLGNGIEIIKNLNKMLEFMKKDAIKNIVGYNISSDISLIEKIANMNDHNMHSDFFKIGLANAGEDVNIIQTFDKFTNANPNTKQQIIKIIKLRTGVPVSMILSIFDNFNKKELESELLKLKNNIGKTDFNTTIKQILSDKAIDIFALAKYKFITDSKFADSFIEFCLQNEKVRFSADFSKADSIKSEYSISLKQEDLASFFNIEYKAHEASNDVAALIKLSEKILKDELSKPDANISNVNNIISKKLDSEGKFFQQRKVSLGLVKQYGYIAPNIDYLKLNLPASIKKYFKAFVDKGYQLPPIRSSSIDIKRGSIAFYDKLGISLDNLKTSFGIVKTNLENAIVNYFDKTPTSTEPAKINEFYLNLFKELMKDYSKYQFSYNELLASSLTATESSTKTKMLQQTITQEDIEETRRVMDVIKKYGSLTEKVSAGAKNKKVIAPSDLSKIIKTKKQIVPEYMKNIVNASPITSDVIFNELVYNYIEYDSVKTKTFIPGKSKDDKYKYMEAKTGKVITTFNGTKEQTYYDLYSDNFITSHVSALQITSSTTLDKELTEIAYFLSLVESTTTLLFMESLTNKQRIDNYVITSISKMKSNKEILNEDNEIKALFIEYNTAKINELLSKFITIYNKCKPEIETGIKKFSTAVDKIVIPNKYSISTNPKDLMEHTKNMNIYFKKYDEIKAFVVKTFEQTTALKQQINTIDSIKNTLFSRLDKGQITPANEDTYFVALGNFALEINKLLTVIKEILKTQKKTSDVTIVAKFQAEIKAGLVKEINRINPDSISITETGFEETSTSTKTYNQWIDKRALFIAETIKSGGKEEAKRGQDALMKGYVMAELEYKLKQRGWFFLEYPVEFLKKDVGVIEYGIDGFFMSPNLISKQRGIGLLKNPNLRTWARFFYFSASKSVSKNVFIVGFADQSIGQSKKSNFVAYTGITYTDYLQFLLQVIRDDSAGTVVHDQIMEKDTGKVLSMTLEKAILSNHKSFGESFRRAESAKRKIENAEELFKELSKKADSTFYGKYKHELTQSQKRTIGETLESQIYNEAEKFSLHYTLGELYSEILVNTVGDK